MLGGLWAREEPPPSRLKNGRGLVCQMGKLRPGGGL